MKKQKGNEYVARGPYFEDVGAGGRGVSSARFSRTWEPVAAVLYLMLGLRSRIQVFSQHPPLRLWETSFLFHFFAGRSTGNGVQAMQEPKDATVSRADGAGALRSFWEMLGEPGGAENRMGLSHMPGMHPNHYCLCFFL